MLRSYLIANKGQHISNNDLQNISTIASGVAASDPEGLLSTERVAEVSVNIYAAIIDHLNKPAKE